MIQHNEKLVFSEITVTITGWTQTGSSVVITRSTVKSVDELLQALKTIGANSISLLEDIKPPF